MKPRMTRSSAHGAFVGAGLTHGAAPGVLVRTTFSLALVSQQTLLQVALLPLLVLIILASAAPAWAQTYVWNNVDTSGGGGFIPGIVFNPTQPDLIYVRTDIGGAYRWDAANRRWIPLMDWVGFDDWNTLGVESIATDPVDPNRFYLAAGTYTNSFTSSNGAILRSTDQGNTFQRVDLPFKLGGNMPACSMGERLVDDEGVKLTNTGAITALSLTITVQNTGGISFSGQYNTVGGSIAQSHSSTSSAITYQFNLSAGQTLNPGTNYLFDAQMGANGTPHATTGDTFTVTYTTAGQTFTQSGRF